MHDISMLRGLIAVLSFWSLMLSSSRAAEGLEDAGRSRHLLSSEQKGALGLASLQVASASVRLLSARSASKQDAVDRYQDAEAWLAANNEEALWILFQQWKRAFSLTYTPEEDRRRFSIFKESLRRVIRQNRRRHGTHWSSLNQFSAMTHDEFSAAMLGAGPEPASEAAAEPPPVTLQSAVPKALDWRASGKVTPAKNQGKCGSCGFFAAAGAMESRFLIDNGETFASSPIDISEQQLVSCVRWGAYQGFNFASAGCSGGFPEESFFFASRIPLALEADYPYLDALNKTSSPCDRALLVSISPQPTLTLKGNDFQQYSIPLPENMKQVIMQGPLAVYMTACIQFRDYEDGVFNFDCPNNYTEGHVMLAVGFGRDPEAGDYVIMKNSWGPQWGQDGFVKMKLTAWPGLCSMFKRPVVRPTSTKSPDPCTNVTCQLSPEEAKAQCVQPKGSCAGACRAGVGSSEFSCSSSCKWKPLPKNTDCGGGRLCDGAGHCIASVRLVGEASAREGRLEVWHQPAGREGSWGTVSSAGFSDAAAAVVCRQLGLPGRGFFYPSPIFGAGPRAWTVWLDGVACSGSEQRLEECQNSGWGATSRGHEYDVGVSCGRDPKVTVRLVGGGDFRSGRVEVWRRRGGKPGQWGTVCSRRFGLEEAQVVCRQLNMSAAGAASRPNAHYGQAAPSAPVWLDSVRCRGTEARLEKCRRRLRGAARCTHAEDVGVECP